MIKQISYKEAVQYLLPRHYSGRIPTICFAYGEYTTGGRLVAVCTFGIPASPFLCKGIAGDKWRKSVLELNRLCREPDYPFILSHFVSECLKRINGNYIIVSYSDTAMNHHGYIYQACNFYYTGSTKRRTDKYVPDGKHARHYDNSQQGEYRLVRSSKHRYVYLIGNKRFKKAVLKDLKYPIYDHYPKGDNSNYVLGDFLKPQLIKVGVANGKNEGHD